MNFDLSVARYVAETNRSKVQGLRQSPRTDCERTRLMCGKLRSARTLLQAMVMMAVLAIGLPAKAIAGSQDGLDGHVDYDSMRREIQLFEAQIGMAINTVFNSSSFALVQKPKGCYLQGYGVTFNFLINIHRAVINTPFGQVRGVAEVTPELKRRRIEELKEKLIRVLMDQGDSFRQLRKDDAVTIVAFFEDRNFPEEQSENKTIVFTATKKDLDELARREDRLKEFKQRMRIVEY
jgi:hypothetical protein